MGGVLADEGAFLPKVMSGLPRTQTKSGVSFDSSQDIWSYREALIYCRFPRPRNFSAARTRRISQSVFLASKQAVFQQIVSIFGASWHSGRTSGFSDRKSPAGQHQIGEAKQGKQLCGVLG